MPSFGENQPERGEAFEAVLRIVIEETVSVLARSLPLSETEFNQIARRARMRMGLEQPLRSPSRLAASLDCRGVPMDFSDNARRMAEEQRLIEIQIMGR